MKILLTAVALSFVFCASAFTIWALSVTVYAHPHQSVCTRTGLTGTGAQENNLYCSGGVNMAPSTYNEVIDFAIATGHLMGTPQRVFESIDRSGCTITVVQFDRGWTAEHHNLNSPCAPDLLVRLYSPDGVWMWTEA